MSDQLNSNLPGKTVSTETGKGSLGKCPNPGRSFTKLECDLIDALETLLIATTMAGPVLKQAIVKAHEVLEKTK